MGGPILERPTARVDERDTMFSRAALEPGTDRHSQFYAAHPELHEVDAALASLPRLLTPGSTFYDAELMGRSLAHFEAIERLRVDPAWVDQELAALRRASDPPTFLGELALRLGAVSAGWTELDPSFVYTHKGRFPEDYGQEVRLDHPRALVFLVEMDWGAMQQAPKAPTILESAHQYFRAARVSLHLEALLQAAGHAAKQHYDAHYDVILPPLAASAGLGELGRNNILIAPRFGSRVRIGCVSTDLPAPSAQPLDLGARSFCAVCKKCAENCPSKALSLGEPTPVRGVVKWPTEVEKCYRYWRQVGTDCGICMACCPYSHKDDAFHGLVRWMVKHLPWTHRMLVWADAVVYGRRWKAKHASHF